jgi:hypothetical protein
MIAGPPSSRTINPPKWKIHTHSNQALVHRNGKLYCHWQASSNVKDSTIKCLNDLQ